VKRYPVPFNRPYMDGREIVHIREAHRAGHLSGDGPFTKRCEAWLGKDAQSRVFLTHSGTAALEMAAILAGIRPGDEILLPSYAFVSTANAFVLRGGVPVFVDIRPDTLNIDEAKIEAAITKRTKALVVLHYGGVSCEMDRILAIAKKHGLAVIEDAAHGVLCSYKGKRLGAMGDFGVYSFHETKSLISGEGGALLVRSKKDRVRAEIIREKGTDRSRFLRGQTDKYTWQDLGSSYLPSDIIAAFLWGQLERAGSIVSRRLRLWEAYQKAFAGLERQGKAVRPSPPAHCRHNGHLYYLLLPSQARRDRFIRGMARAGIHTVFHFVPLHSSPAGKKYGRAGGSLAVTADIASRLVRLPLWIGLEKHQARVIRETKRLLD
jgi:dTDP-4-amino-4,6-dideoxygalactose transaminase